jgi:hypothetical protein
MVLLIANPYSQKMHLKTISGFPNASNKNNQPHLFGVIQPPEVKFQLTILTQLSRTSQREEYGKPADHI